MIIILHGGDSYRSDQKLREIVGGYKKKNKSGINLKYLGENPSFLDLKDESGQLGMFEEKRLLVGKSVLEDKKIKNKLEENLKIFTENENILILREDKKIKGKLTQKVKKLKGKNGMVKEYKKLEGKRLKNWYIKEFSKYDAEVSRGVVEKIVDYVGSDLWRGANEVAKLSNLKTGKKVNIEDVIDHVKPNLETDIFKTMDALGRGNKKLAVELLQKHLQQGDSPFYLLSMINNQVKNLMIVKQLKESGLSNSEAKKRSKMHPFVFKKSVSQAESVSFKKIKKTHQELFKVDLDSKLGKISPEMGIMKIISRF